MHTPIHERRLGLADGDLPVLTKVSFQFRFLSSMDERAVRMAWLRLYRDHRWIRLADEMVQIQFRAPRWRDMAPA